MPVLTAVRPVLRAALTCAALAALLAGGSALAASAEPAARAALARAGVAGSDVALALRAEWDLGTDRAVRFERSVAGHPVFGGDAVVLLDPAGAPRFVRGAPLPPPSGTFRVPERTALDAAVGALGPGARPSRAPVAEAGWVVRADALRPVFRVDVPATSPSGAWQVLVDAETGAVLSVRDLRQSIQGSVYPLSPAETPAQQCPLTGSGTNQVHTLCAPTADVTLAGLSAGATTLTGDHAQAFDCAGGDSPAIVSSATCTQVGPDGTGNFRFTPDPTNGSTTDAFASVNAYWNVDDTTRWFATLAPSAPLPPRLSLYVNAYYGGQPFQNAFYDPQTDTLTFGQSTSADFSYDGPVVSHETVHAWQWALGRLDPTLDGRGLNLDPLSLAEGTADALAVSRVGRPQLGLYVAAESGDTEIRDVRSLLTCQGTGTPAYQTSSAISVDGVIGEPHLDSLVWSGYFWDLFAGLAGQKGCNGACDVAPELQARALQLASGPGVTFHEMANAVVAAAQALHPEAPAIAAFATCLESRHALPGCDGRTVPLYAGEHKFALVPLDVIPMPGSFQPTIAVSAAQGQVGACAYPVGPGQPLVPGTLHLRRGSPVAVGSTTGGALTFTSDTTLRVDQACGTSTSTKTLVGSGTWYALLVADQVAQPTGDFGLYQLDVLSGTGARPATAAPTTCALGATTGSTKSGGGCGCGTDGGAGAALGLLAMLAFVPRLRRRTA